jgi:hypothetical protein
MSRVESTEAEGQLARNVVDAANFFESIEFAVPLPTSFVESSSNMYSTENHERIIPLTTGFEDYGVVGVVSILSQKSVMIWLGWGQVRSPVMQSEDPATTLSDSSCVGRCTYPFQCIFQLDGVPS